MKVICDRAKLHEGLAIAGSVVSGKAAKPIYENICLVASDDKLEILGTDAEVSIRFSVDDVSVEEPGPTVVPGKVMLDFVRDLSGETVTMRSDDGTCVLSSGSDECELVTMDPDEFPVIPRFTDAKTVSLQGGSFIRLVQQTAFAAAREPGRYAMHGVLAEFDDDSLKLVATDGRRLAVASVPVDGAPKDQESAIVPTKGMNLFCRVISDALEQVQVAFDEQQASLRTKNAEIFARLIDGEFPRYAAVITSDPAFAIEADRELLARKMRLVSNVVGDEARAVNLSFSPGQVELFGFAAGRGEAKAHMEVGFKDEKAEIAFNPDFVIEGLKHCQEDKVWIEFNDHTSPGKFRLGENYIYVVMPITVAAKPGKA